MPFSTNRYEQSNSSGFNRQAQLYNNTANGGRGDARASFRDFLNTPPSQGYAESTNPSLATPTAAVNPLPVTGYDTQNPGFETYSGYNSSQYANKDTATGLAGMLGGTVNMTNPVGPVQPPAQRMIEFSDGFSGNAGLLAERYAKYPKHVADAMTASERGTHTNFAAGNALHPAPGTMGTPPIAPSSGVTPPSATPPPGSAPMVAKPGLAPPSSFSNPELQKFIQTLLGGGANGTPMSNPLEAVMSMMNNNVSVDSLMSLMALVPAMQSFMGMMQPPQQESNFWYSRPRFRTY